MFSHWLLAYESEVVKNADKRSYQRFCRSVHHMERWTGTSQERDSCFLHDARSDGDTFHPPCIMWYGYVVQLELQRKCLTVAADRTCQCHTGI